MLFLPPTNAKLLVVGEAPGEQEERTKLPFMGAAGQMLRQELRIVELDPATVAYTNVFSIRPKNNDLAAFNVPKDDWLRLAAPFPWAQKRKNISKDLWPNPELVEFFLKRLISEIEQVKPNLILALGNTALWALTGIRGITAQRGTVLTGDLVLNVKILPTFHPASLFRQWANRAPFAADLQKAARESVFPEIRRMSRKLWLLPSCTDLVKFERQHIAVETGPLSTDIETPINTLACIALARNEKEALVLPFLDRSKKDWNYWATHNEEVFAYRWLKRIMEDQAIPKLFQNGLFDIQHLARHHIYVRNATHDTMLLHHSMYSEMPKGLGFLGSIYTDEVAWKNFRPKGNNVEKSDE